MRRSDIARPLTVKGVDVTVVDRTPDQRTDGDPGRLPELPHDAAPAVVVATVRDLLQEITGRWLPESQSVSLPGGLSGLATTARVPIAVPYQLASLVLGVPLAQPEDPWTVAPLRAWAGPATVDRLRAIPLHFDGDAIHYAIPETPTLAQSAAVADAFGVRTARALLCTPESVGIWSLPTDPGRRPARPVLDTALTSSNVWMAALRRLPLPRPPGRELGAVVGLGGSTAAVVGDPRAIDVLGPIVTRLTGLPVAHAQVPPDVEKWLAESSESAPTPSAPELVEQLRCLPTTLRGLGWHGALAGLAGDQRVRIAAWALGVPWLSAEVAALIAARRPQQANDLFTDPDWAVGPWTDGRRRRAVVVGVPPLTPESDPAHDAYAEALLSAPLADALSVEVAATAMSRVQAGATLDEALTEIAPELSVSALLAQHVGLPTVDLDPQPHEEAQVDALGRARRAAHWDDPVGPPGHPVLDEPGVVPVQHDPDGTLVVAVADPLEPGLLTRLTAMTTRPVRMAVAPRDQIERARKRLLARGSLEIAALQAELSAAQRHRVRLHCAQWKVSPAQAVLDLGLLAESAPAERRFVRRVTRRRDDSADLVLTPDQKIVLTASALLLGMTVLLVPWPTLSALTAFVLALLATTGAVRLWGAVRVRRVSARVAPPRSELAETPIVTLLVPLAACAVQWATVVKRLSAFDYPPDRLDVKLLVDEDALAVQATLGGLTLPEYAEVLVVPGSKATGRYKAANYGLMHARGRYVLLHDPAARAEPNLLREAVRTFHTSPPDVVALQAGLRHRNEATGPLARLLAAGYAITFGSLPELCRGRVPIPLGPTSTFFRTDWLRTAGGWDPHNRTAQADLGIRIPRLGGRVAALNSVTDHPAATDVRDWVNRCTRCVVGYLQTYLVHMRRPRQLLGELGVRGFLSFQCAVAGTTVAFVAFPVLWFLGALWAGGAGWVGQVFPGPTPVALGVLAASTGLFVLAHLLARRTRRDGGGWRLLLTPWYWSVRLARARRALPF